MADDLITIEGTKRSDVGKRATKLLRKNGLIPANILDKGKAQSITLVPKWLGRAHDKHDKKFRLSLDGSVKTVRIHEVHIDHIKRKPLHVDLVYCSE